jgi:hypothetical protein
MTNTSNTRKLKRFQYAATLLGALAIVTLAPATAHADDKGGSGPSGGCHYTDPDGYDIPIDEGQGVIVGGKTVTCTGGTIVVSNAPNTTGGRPIHVNPGQPVLTRNASTLQLR